ncbi:hypothetical protein [Pseudoduganella aquatica]|uniref:hypothetical protein n=1 Tax=Pseudoduganella aquatica TaxID=2660641 RepID=UPI001E4FB7A4|nr:hypothetical protein [Pseudoduganella aquatica]
MSRTASSPMLLSDEQRAAIVQLAADAGLSNEEFLFRASLSLLPERSRRSLKDLLDRAIQSIESTCAAIDETVAFVEASEQRMAARDAGTQGSQ